MDRITTTTLPDDEAQRLLRIFGLLHVIWRGSCRTVIAVRLDFHWSSYLVGENRSCQTVAQRVALTATIS